MLPAQFHALLLIASALARAKWVDACNGGGESEPCFPRVAGEERDWVFGLMLPRSTGLITVSNNHGETDSKWTFWPHVTKEPSPLYSTFSQFTALDPYMLYNDQMDKTCKFTNSAHSKGFLHQTKEGGFWLHHSVPQFLPLPRLTGGFTGFVEKHQVKSADNILNPQHACGQHFFMIKLEPADGPNNPIADIMNVARNTILRNIRNQFQFGGAMPLEAGIQRTIGRFRSFAVKSTFRGDIAVYIAQQLGVSLSCTSWAGISGDDEMLSQVPGLVHNIRLLRTPAEADVSNFPEMKESKTSFHKDFTEYTWGPSYDHSKWCVQDDTVPDPDHNWVCVRGTNRAVPQVKRGSDAICVDDKTLNALLRKLIVVVSADTDSGQPTLVSHVQDSSTLPQNILIKRPELSLQRTDSKPETTDALLSLLNSQFNAYTHAVESGNILNGGDCGAFPCP